MKRFLFVLAVIVLLCGCGSAEPAPTPEPTPTAAPTPTPNPWVTFGSEEEAETAAGFEIRLPKVEGAAVAYNVMVGSEPMILEAVFSDGDREVFRVRKVAGEEYARGDAQLYSYTEAVQPYENIPVTLSGDDENNIRRAVWSQTDEGGEYSYCISYAADGICSAGALKLVGTVAENLPKAYERSMNKPIAVGENHTVALRRDGTVLATGWNYYGQCDVEDWTDIVAVAAGDCHTVGLRRDGTVLVTGADNAAQCRGVDTWSDIAVITADESTTYGFKADGTLVYAGGHNDKRADHALLASIADSVELLDHSMFLCRDRKIHVVDWRGREQVFLWNRYFEENDRPIRDVACTTTGGHFSAWMHTFVFLEDGTVLNEILLSKDAVVRTSEIAEMPELFGALEIVGDTDFAVALMPDGTVVRSEWSPYGCWLGFESYDTSRWNGILDVAADNGHFVGLRSDGTLLADGSNEYGQCDVSEWTNIGFPGSDEPTNEVMELSFEDLF